GRDVVEISESQVQGFLGNCLEVSGRDGPALVMSVGAAGSLSTAQRRRIERSCRILTAAVPTIEAAGGSVRCMIAGIHLPTSRSFPRADPLTGDDLGRFGRLDLGAGGVAELVHDVVDRQGGDRAQRDAG